MYNHAMDNCARVIDTLGCMLDVLGFPFTPTANAYCGWTCNFTLASFA
jgi:hypothetical protein